MLQPFAQTHSPSGSLTAFIGLTILFGPSAGCLSKPADPMAHECPAMRIVWTSKEDVLRRIAALPSGSEAGAPVAVRLLEPSDLAREDFDAVVVALEGKHYEHGDDPCGAIEELTSARPRVYLASPLVAVAHGQGAPIRAAVKLLWQHDIPFRLDVGNSLTISVPQRVAAAVVAMLGQPPR
jgi:hypothetical protein